MTDLILSKSTFDLPEQYLPMLSIVLEMLPEVQRATNLFQKTQSQFMDNMLTVSHLTPIRNARQILAEMKKTRQALGEAYYAVEKKKIEIEEKKEERLDASLIKKKRIDIEIEELEFQISSILENVSGAVRKLANYSLQYQSILKENHIESFDEYDFEAEEEKYHIITAFSQGLNAARSHGGWIDEGNQIYFQQIGINGTVAQVEMTKYLQLEERLFQEGKEPTHLMQIKWLLSMAEKFKGCSEKLAAFKGMSVHSDDALLR